MNAALRRVVGALTALTFLASFWIGLGAVEVRPFDDTGTATAASSVPPGDVSPEAPAPQQVDQHDDSRVEVQLVVLGVALGVVVGVGTAAYFLRKRLGLVAGPPDQTGAHH